MEPELQGFARYARTQAYTQKNKDGGGDETLFLISKLLYYINLCYP